MKRGIAVTLGLGLSLLFYFVGCERSSNVNQASNPVSQTDQAAIASLISQDALFTTDNSALNDGAPSSLQKASNAIVPRFWGRWIKNASRNVTYDQVDDTTVIATVAVNLTGQVWIRVKDTTKDTTIYKPLDESIVHKAKFIKFVGKDTSHVHWRLAEISGIQGGTTNGGITIQNVSFIVDTETIQITDPLNTFFYIGWRFGFRGCPELIPNPATNFKVQVTVKSSDPDSDIVVAHRPIWFNFACVYRRAPMSLVSSVSNGDGTFTRIYEHEWKGAYIGRFHVFVGAITRQSIYDDQASFASSDWGIPYIVNSN